MSHKTSVGSRGITGGAQSRKDTLSRSWTRPRHSQLTQLTRQTNLKIATTTYRRRARLADPFIAKHCQACHETGPGANSMYKLTYQVDVSLPREIRRDMSEQVPTYRGDSLLAGQLTVLNISIQWRFTIGSVTVKR